MNIGDTQQLTASVSPSDATNQTVTWSSSNSAVATVSNVGLVTAVGEGSATITATAADGSGVFDQCSIQVSSAPSLNATVEVKSASGTPGSDVAVDIMLSENPGISVFKLFVGYDASAMYVKDVETGSAASGFSIISNAEHSGQQTVYLVSPNDSTANGCLIKVIFAVNSNAPAGTYPVELGYNFYETYNEQGANITLSTIGGYITVGSSVKLGDVNEDGNVNSRDVFVLMRSLVGLETLSASQRQAADVNGDGSVNSRDVFKLLRVLVGLDTLDGKGGKPVKGAPKTTANVAADAVTAKPGETVDMPIRISGNPGLAACRVYVDFDSSDINVLDLVAGDAMPGAQFIAAEVEPGRWQALIVNTKDSKLDGVLATVKIKVGENANGEYPITLSYDQADTYNELGSDVKLNITNGKITVKGDTPVESVAVTGVELDKQVLSLTLKKTAILAATVRPIDASDKTVTWSSSDASIASVKDGTVTATGAGSAIITVTTNDGGYSASCAVTVTTADEPVNPEKPTKIYIVAPYGTTMDIDDWQQLKVEFEPVGSSDDVIWSSNKNKIASVSSYGSVDTYRKEGSAKITARTRSGLTATITIKVVDSEKPTSIKFKDTSPFYIKVGDEEKLYITILPESAEYADKKWSSSNKKVVTVDEYGWVTGLKPGTAKITVKAIKGGKKATIKVKVVK